MILTKKQNPTMILTPKPSSTPTLQLTPQPHVPYQQAFYTAMNQNTQSPVLFRDLTA